MTTTHYNTWKKWRSRLRPHIFLIIWTNVCRHSVLNADRGQQHLSPSHNQIFPSCPVCFVSWWHHQVNGGSRLFFLPFKSGISIKMKASYSLKWKSSECLSCGQQTVFRYQFSFSPTGQHDDDDETSPPPPPVWTHSFLAGSLIN